MDCYVGLGSNLGDRLRHLRAGVDGLAQEGLEPERLSSVWETEPLAATGGWFLNMVARCTTRLDPHEALAALQRIEQRAGRTRPARGAARTLDLDLLLFDASIIDEPGLHVPHARMWERRFVLEPLAEIDPRLRNPRDGRTVEQALRSLGAVGGVRKLDRLASR